MWRRACCVPSRQNGRQVLFTERCSYVPLFARSLHTSATETSQQYNAASQHAPHRNPEFFNRKSRGRGGRERPTHFKQDTPSVEEILRTANSGRFFRVNALMADREKVGAKLPRNFFPQMIDAALCYDDVSVAQLRDVLFTLGKAQLEPTWAGLLGLVRLYARQGQMDQAMGLFRRLKQVGPTALRGSWNTLVPEWASAHMIADEKEPRLGGSTHYTPLNPDFDALGDVYRDLIYGWNALGEFGYISALLEEVAQFEGSEEQMPQLNARLFTELAQKAGSCGNVTSLETFIAVAQQRGCALDHCAYDGLLTYWASNGKLDELDQFLSLHEAQYKNREIDVWRWRCMALSSRGDAAALRHYLFEEGKPQGVLLMKKEYGLFIKGILNDPTNTSRWEAVRSFVNTELPCQLGLLPNDMISLRSYCSSLADIAALLVVYDKGGMRTMPRYIFMELQEKVNAIIVMSEEDRILQQSCLAHLLLFRRFKN